MVGGTPCVRFVSQETGNARVYVKLEGNNPTGAVKDRPCLWIIRDMIEKGELQPGMTLLDASSGNFAGSVAFLGKVLGYPTEVVATKSKLTPDKLKFLEYFGAKVTIMGQFTYDGNRHCRKLAEEAEPAKYCFLDQLHNWANPRAHYESTGVEIAADFSDLDLVVGSLGSGGTMYGVGKYLRENRPEVKILAVQAASGTVIPGMGAFDDGDYVTPFIAKGLGEKLYSLSKIYLKSAIQRTKQLRDQGIFCGIGTGGSLHAALEKIAQDRLEGNVVIISGDSGWRNLDRLLTI
ncbi:MAG: pyridoxal-phosphate dependent enzyme [Acidobacteriota bacterium]